jgi:hypothetical protein
MPGSTVGNRKAVVPLIVIALGAICVAGLRVTKSIERSRADQNAAAASAQQEASQETGESRKEAGSVSIEPANLVLVARRDPFEHPSLFQNTQWPSERPSASGLGDLAGIFSSSPMSQLGPLMPQIGPGSITTDAGTGTKNSTQVGPGSGEAGEAAGPADPGYSLVSIVSGTTPLAIITDSTGRKFFASEGETLGAGFVLESIHSRSVVLCKDGVRISLWLDSDKNH